MSLRWRGAGSDPSRRPQRGRLCRLADRVRPARSSPHTDDSRREPRRGPGPGRPRRRARAVAGDGRAGQSDRMAHDRGEAPSHRPLPAHRDHAPQGRRAGRCQRQASGGGARRRKSGRLHRGRRPPPRIPVLQSGADARVTGGADPAARRRPHHGRDRPRIPRHRVHHGATDLPGEEDAVGGPRRVRAAGGSGTDRAARTT